MVKGQIITHCQINSMSPGVCDFDFKCVILNCIVVIIFKSISSTVAFRWMAQDLTDDNSTLVQVMPWCLTAPSHYLNQCWLRSIMPYVASHGHNELKFMKLASVMNLVLPTFFLINPLHSFMHWPGKKSLLDFRVKSIQVTCAMLINPSGAKTRIIQGMRILAWLLMPWLPETTGHQQP